MIHEQTSVHNGKAVNELAEYGADYGQEIPTGRYGRVRGSCNYTSDYARGRPSERKGVL